MSRVKTNPTVASLQPWSRIHLDLAGPFLDHMYMFLVIHILKWIDVHQMQKITLNKSIEIGTLTHGLPVKLS